jgi:Tfp pilus assembly protein PilN
MTQVNLLPGDVRERQRTRQATVLVGLAGLAVVVLLAFVFVIQLSRLSNAQHRLDAQKSENAVLQGKVDQLQQFAVLKQELAQKQALVSAARSGAVAWSGILRDISMVIPNQMWLTTMTASVDQAPGSTALVVPVGPSATQQVPTSPSPSPSSSPSQSGPVVTAPLSPSTGLVATIQFQGMASDYPTVALWLTRLEQVHGWLNAWVSSATKDVSTSSSCTPNADGTQTCTTDPNAGKVTFSGTVDLSTLATIDGGKQ